MVHDCGTEVAEGMLLCPGCGHRLVGVVAPAPAATAAVPPPAAAPQEPAAPAPQATVPQATVRRCTTPWCQREIPPGAERCAFCDAPAASPEPASTSPTQGGAACPAITAVDLVLPDATLLPLVGALDVGRECGNPAIDRALAPLLGVSRRHARLELADGTLRVQDLGSRNGTTVDGVPVTGSVVLPLSTAQIRIGLGRNCTLTVQPKE